MSTKKSHREKLAKIKAVIESSIDGAKVKLCGETATVRMPDGSFAHARELPGKNGPAIVIEPEPQATEDEPPAKHSRNARSRKWWNLDPWERKR